MAKLNPKQPPTVQPKKPATAKGTIEKVPHASASGPSQHISKTGKG